MQSNFFVFKIRVFEQNLKCFYLKWRFFKVNHPARACYQVAALPKGARVEIEAVAIHGNIVDE